MWHVICDTNQPGAFKYVEENSVIIHLFNLIYIITAIEESIGLFLFLRIHELSILYGGQSILQSGHARANKVISQSQLVDFCGNGLD